MKHKIICADYLEVVHTIETSSVDLIILDSPYNINKAEWDRIPNYVEWLGRVFLECQRVLKDNGSFYFFHNDFLQLVKLQQWISDNTDFVFKQLIVWNKRFDGVNNKGYLDGFVEVGGLRNYQQMAEYILYYTFQDETGLTKILPLCFIPYLNYMTQQKENIRWNTTKFNEYLGYKSIASHWFWQDEKRQVQEQPRFIQYKDYIELQKTGFFQKEYEKLRQEYEKLRQEYESLRYTFNNQKTHHSLWNYEITKKQGHITSKPIKLIKNIIKHSSNEGDIVLDPMCGSGTTLVAAERLGRNSIGIEISKEYAELSYKRLREEIVQSKFEKAQSTIEKVGF